jgi:uncharacterized membrane protein
MIGEEKRSYRTIYLLSIAAVVLLFVLSGYVWFQTPGSGERGVPGRFLTIFAIPILIAVIMGLLPLFARIEPRQLHIAQSHKAFTTIWAILLLFFMIVHTILLLGTLGRRPAIATYWPILAGLVTIVMGNYLGKIRSNYFAGFRTPWTLSSELSWNKTHRLGGKLLFLLGIILIAGSILVLGDFWAYFLLVSSLLWAVVLVIYSYFIWKRDPDRKDIKLSPDS